MPVYIILLSVYLTGNMANRTVRNQNCRINMLILEFNHPLKK